MPHQHGSQDPATSRALCERCSAPHSFACTHARPPAGPPARRHYTVTEMAPSPTQSGDDGRCPLLSTTSELRINASSFVRGFRATFEAVCVQLTQIRFFLEKIYPLLLGTLWAIFPYITKFFSIFCSGFFFFFNFMIQMFGHFFPKIYTRKNSPKIPLFLSKYDKLLQEQYYRLRVV